jgi:hypothetical protein
MQLCPDRAPQQAVKLRYVLGPKQLALKAAMALHWKNKSPARGGICEVLLSAFGLCVCVCVCSPSQYRKQTVSRIG